MKIAYRLATILAFSAPLTFAPFAHAQDGSGAGLLAGNSYRFRYVAPLNYNQTTGAVSEVFAAEGVITFQSGGTYTIAAGSQYIDNTQNSGKPQAFPAAAATSEAGTYVINAAGLGYISSPLAVLSSTYQGAVEFGTLSGVGTSTATIFTGSATESGLNDMFVMMLVGTPPTSFTSSYWLGILDFAGGGDILLKNAITEIVPSGGGLGPLTVTGYANNFQAGTLLTQTVNGATASFAADGGATLTLPLPSGVTTANAMFTGSRLVYTSADGNFLLGWNPNGYDIVFGVKALATTATNSTFSGVYYTANLTDIPLVVKSGNIQSGCGAESFWGSELSYGNGSEVEHQRFLSTYCSFTGSATDFGTDNYTDLSSNGTAQDSFGNYYAFGATGSAFVSVSNSGGTYGLTIGVHAPTFCTGSSLCLNPTGVFNAANWDPVTAGIAPGEDFTLFGTGFASSKLATQGGTPFGDNVGTTQVLVNGEPAPIFYASPTQINATMPYSTSGSTSYTAEVQVNNGGILSNQISVYLTDADSGIFTLQSNGIGDAIAEHANGTLITSSSPAQPGETIVLALTGMGTVSPTVTDGAVGPSNPLSYANVFTNTTNCTTTTPNCNLLVEFNDYLNNSTFQQATVAFAGLYPGLAGLYQMNVTVPTTVGPGDVYIEVVTDAADVEQVTICVTGSCSASAAVAATAQAKLGARSIEGGLSPQLLQHRKAPHASPTSAAVRMFKPSGKSFSRVPAPPASPAPQN